MDADRIDKYITQRNLSPFPIDERGFYHNMVSLIISQRIRFSQARRIRSKIYEILGESTLDQIMTLTESQRTQCGLGPAKWQVIADFSGLFEKGSVSTDYTTIKGIGPWTINCAQLMAGDYSCGFLSTDSSVNALVRRVLQRDLSSREIESLYSDREAGGRAFSALWNSLRNQ